MFSSSAEDSHGCKFDFSLHLWCARYHCVCPWVEIVLSKALSESDYLLIGGFVGFLSCLGDVIWLVLVDFLLDDCVQTCLLWLRHACSWKCHVDLVHIEDELLE